MLPRDEVAIKNGRHMNGGNKRVHRMQRFFWRVRTSAKRDYQLPHVCPSVRMEQLGAYYQHFHEQRYLSIFRDCVEKIQVSLKLHNSNGYFMWGPINISIKSLSFLLKLENVSDNSFTEHQNIYFMFHNSSENHTVYEIIWKNILQPCRPHMTI